MQRAYTLQLIIQLFLWILLAGALQSVVFCLLVLDLTR